LYIDIDGVYVLSDQAQEKSKKLDEEMRQLEQTNIQQGTINLQIRQELNEKIVALDQSEIARKLMAERLRVLETAKVALEQQLKEINEHKADIAT